MYRVTVWSPFTQCYSYVSHTWAGIPLFPVSDCMCFVSSYSLSLTSICQQRSCFVCADYSGITLAALLQGRPNHAASRGRLGRGRGHLSHRGRRRDFKFSNKSKEEKSITLHTLNIRVYFENDQKKHKVIWIKVLHSVSVFSVHPCSLRRPRMNGSFPAGSLAAVDISFELRKRKGRAGCEGWVKKNCTYCDF